MASSTKGPSAYKVQSDFLQRFPHKYYITPFTSPPSAPLLPPTQRRYFYLDVSPPTGVHLKATLLLLHGFPDSSYGWRNVISPLTLSGYRCIVPDLVGYGRTSKPTELGYYGAHSQALDLNGLMTQVLSSEKEKFAVVGHDWGSWLAWKLANWMPERLLGVHGICVSYLPATTKFVSVTEMAKKYPQYGYQMFFEDRQSTAVIQENLDVFLNLVYASPKLIKSSPDLKKLGFVKEGGLKKSLMGNDDLLPTLSQVSLLSQEDYQMMHLLFDEKMGGTIDGPLNWYRSRLVNHEEDKALTSKMLPRLPYKMLVPDLDATAPLSLAESTRRFIPTGATFEIETVKNCGHWVLMQYPEQACESILTWLDKQVLPNQASLVDKVRSKL